MDKDDYRATLETLGLTQVGGAALLGVNERTSRRWALGKQDVPVPVERFLRLLIAAKITPARVHRLLD